jgi:predicted ATPase
MITKVEARGFQCLRDVSQTLKPYQILVGPNGSGKSAFLDVIAFIGDVASSGVQEAVAKRTSNFYDLVWGRTEKSFSLALEYTDREIDRPLRYETEIGINANDSMISIMRESLTSLKLPDAPPVTSEGPHIFSILRTSAATWPGTLPLIDVMKVALDNALLRSPSPPGALKHGTYDGSSCALLVEQLRSVSPDTFASWLEHVQTAVPDIAGIRVVDRPEDRHRYLMVQYSGGVEVPQWMVSDGTLRLLSLTLLAYLPGRHGVYLVEEPEIGLHPTAIETVMQSWSSVYDGQVLLTSHSPTVLSLPRSDQLLCFQKSQEGVAIIPGDQHPLLQEWKSGVNLADLFAAGVLG